MYANVIYKSNSKITIYSNDRKRRPTHKHIYSLCVTHMHIQDQCVYLHSKQMPFAEQSKWFCLTSGDFSLKSKYEVKLLSISNNGFSVEKLQFNLIVNVIVKVIRSVIDAITHIWTFVIYGEISKGSCILGCACTKECYRIC